MSSKPKPYLTCRLFPFLDVLECDPVEREIQDAVQSDDKSRSPLRVSLEKRSDFSFVADILAEVSNQGLDIGFSTAVVMAVVNRPAVALSRHDRDSKVLRIRQAVIVQQRASDYGPLRVILSINVAPVKPPQVQEYSITIEPVDPSSDLQDLMIDLENWRTEYDIREPAHDPSRKLASWGWLGDPLSCGYQDVPKDWRARVLRLGATVGVATNVVLTLREVQPQNVSQTLDLGIRIRGARGWDNTHDVFRDGPDLLEVGTPGTTFDDLLRETRQVLVNRIELVERASLDEVRALEANEIVFHRKLSGGRAFDVFDSGHEKACVHGQAAFKHWSGDKAVKGMARLYTNFVPAMLIHCSHYPNCGMYGVDASRGI